jgi:multidrug resistance efflux pump
MVAEKTHEVEIESTEKVETIENQTAENQTVNEEPTQEPVQEPKKRNPKTIALGIVVAIAIIAGGAFAVHTLLMGQRTISTGNARVTTNYVTLTSTIPGLLERFHIYEGMKVEAGQIIGWVQYGETFRSPFDGVVVDVNVIAEQHVMPMQPLATIADLSNLHIQANFYESHIENIILGQPVSVTLDGLRGRTLAGYVRNISRITEVELAGGHIVMATGTFRRITHTVPVEIVITDDVDLSYFLGTNARVSLPVFAQ